RTQNLDGAIRVDAVRSAAVGDVFLVLWKILQAALQGIDGYRERAGDVAGDIFAGRTGVEDEDVARSRAREQLLHRDELGVRAIAEVVPDQPLEIGESPFGHLA